jgi:propionyl-CoA carboxylase alpha chain
VITTVLVANRGEIARRVFATCRALGLGTVAVFSDADAGSPHVAEADAAVRLPGTAPADTYLRADRLVEAARRAGADAVHPGYGFLSENAEFARAAQAAGLTWIGPSPQAIEAMGSKIEAKKIMAAAGVPVLPELDPDTLAEGDLPVLIKASAGGGGRGMRVVRVLDDLAREVEAARAEAASAFGDATVFCEPYLAAATAASPIALRRAGSMPGAGASSITFWCRRWIEHSRSPIAQTVPCWSAMTCTSMWRPVAR